MRPLTPQRIDRSSYALGRYNSLGSGTDHVEHCMRLRKHWHVTACQLNGCSAHALRQETFQLGLNGAVFAGDDVPAWFRPPRGAFGFLRKKVRCWCRMGRPDEPLLLFRQVPREALDALWTHPHASIGHFNV